MHYEIIRARYIRFTDHRIYQKLQNEKIQKFKNKKNQKSKSVSFVGYKVILIKSFLDSIHDFILQITTNCLKNHH